MSGLNGYVFKQGNGGGGSGSGFFAAVSNYASLPSAVTADGKYYFVLNPSGSGNLSKPAGAYYATGGVWYYDTAYEDHILVVANYSAIPAPSPATTGQFYWASASQGTAWLPGSLGGTYYSAGMYYDNGTTLEFLSVPYQATQAEVNTGTNTDKFVTPSTLANSTQWATKLTSTLINGYIFVGNASNLAIGVQPTLSASGGVFNLSNTGVFTFPNADASTRGLLTSTDWNTFNGKFNLPSLANGSVLFSNGTTISENNASFFWDNTNSILYNGANSGGLTNARFAAYGNTNASVQNTIMNSSSGTAASSDFVATADTGNNTTKFINVGINSSGFTGNTAWGNALDGYAYVDGGDFWIGTNSASKNLYFVTGGGLDANRRGFVNSTGGFNIGGASAIASGNLHEINGSISGSATFTLTSGVTNATTTITYAANTTVKVGDRVSGTNISVNTYIAYIVSSTQATLNKVASGSSSGITFTITPLVTGENYLLATTGATGLFVTGANFSPVVTGVGAAKNVIGYNFQPRLVGTNASDILIGLDARGVNYTGTLTSTNCHEFALEGATNVNYYFTTNNHTTQPRIQQTTTNYVEFFNSSGVANITITSSLATASYLLNLTASSTGNGITYSGSGTALSALSSNQAGVPVVNLNKSGTGNAFQLGCDEIASATTNRGIVLSSNSPAISLSILSTCVLMSYNSTSGLLVAEGGIGTRYQLKMNATKGAVEVGGHFVIGSNIGVGTEQSAQVFYTMDAGTNAERMRLQGLNLGIGITNPTAKLHIAAGTTAAAPLLLTSGTNLTTAVAGSFEYNGTNLFFTRTGTTRENVLVAVDNVAAPTTSVGVAITNYYGSAATNFLGDPNRWLSVNVLGVVYKIPLYT